MQSAKLSIPSNRQSPIAVELGFGVEPPGDSLTAVFDWRQTGPQTWEIEVQTRAGVQAAADRGGAKLEVDGQPVETPPSQEYPDLYARFAELLDEGESDVDLRPFRTRRRRLPVRRTRAGSESRSASERLFETR